jgi:glutathione S-transferase
MLTRIADLYVMPAVFSLFPLAGAARRDPEAVRAIFERIEAGLGHLEHFVGSGRYFVGDALTLADCALAPHLAFMGWFLPLFANEAVPADRPELESRARAARADEHVARALGEMERAFPVLRERLEKRARPPAQVGGGDPGSAVDKDGRKQA